MNGGRTPSRSQVGPHLAVAAERRGVMGVLSVPATWGDDLVATLNLYSRTGPFDDTAVSLGYVLATQVSIAVSRSPEFSAARAVVEEAQRDADDHAEINLASGLLMVSQGCTAEQAEGSCATQRRTTTGRSWRSPSASSNSTGHSR